MAQRHDIEPHGTARMTNVATAVKHPTRQRALEILNQREASPSDISHRLGEPIANVTYHMKILLRLGVIERVPDRTARSASDQPFRATAAPIVTGEDWADVPAPARRQLEQMMLDLTVEDWTSSREADLLDTLDEPHYSLTHLELDEQAWREISAELLDVVRRAHARQVAARDRLAASGEGAARVTTTLAMAHFPARPVTADGPAESPPS